MEKAAAVITIRGAHFSIMRTSRQVPEAGSWLRWRWGLQTSKANLSKKYVHTTGWHQWTLGLSNLSNCISPRSSLTNVLDQVRISHRENSTLVEHFIFHFKSTHLHWCHHSAVRILAWHLGYWQASELQKAESSCSTGIPLAYFYSTPNVLLTTKRQVLPLMIHYTALLK
jgi:hypothetical protein